MTTRRGPPKNALLQQVQDMTEAGATLDEIAAETGRHRGVIHRWRVKYKMRLTPKPHVPRPRITRYHHKNMSPKDKKTTIEMRAAGYSYKTIADTQGRDIQTVKRVCLRNAAEIAAMKEPVDDLYDGAAFRSLSSITDDDIRKSSFLQRITAAAIATDKMRLLRGESTQNFSIHAVVTSLDEEYRKRQLAAAHEAEGKTIDVPSDGG